MSVPALGACWPRLAGVRNRLPCWLGDPTELLIVDQDPSDVDSSAETPTYNAFTGEGFQRVRPCFGIVRTVARKVLKTRTATPKTGDEGREALPATCRRQPSNLRRLAHPSPTQRWWRESLPSENRDRQPPRVLRCHARVAGVVAIVSGYQSTPVRVHITEF